VREKIDPDSITKRQDAYLSSCTAAKNISAIDIDDEFNAGDDTINDGIDSNMIEKGPN
jgi:hypothetical protein